MTDEKLKINLEISTEDLMNGLGAAFAFVQAEHPDEEAKRVVRDLFNQINEQLNIKPAGTP